MASVAKSQRTILKSALTKLSGRISKCNAITIDRVELETLRSKLKIIESKLEANHNDILSQITDAGLITDQNKDHDDIIDKIQDIEDKLIANEKEVVKREKEEDIKTRERLAVAKANAEHAAASANPIPGHNTTPTIQKPQLPKLSLPKFSGNLEEWLNFRDRFEQSVHSRADLSGAEKMQYLLSSLEGSAAAVLEGTPVNNSSYHSAWDLLKNQFEHTRELIYRQGLRMLDQTVVTVRSSTALQTVVTTTRNALQAMKNLGQPTDQWDGLVIIILLKKLDRDTKLRFHQSLTSKDMPSMQTLMNFLEKEIVDLTSSGEVVEPSVEKFQTKHVQSNGKQPFRKDDKTPCVICQEQHFIFSCTKLNESSDIDKKKLVDKAKLCTNCLKPGHVWKGCNSKFTCKECKSKHHTILHSYFNSNSKKKPTTATTLATSRSVSQACIKPTAVVHALNHRGQPLDCRVVLDSASDACFITASLVNQLGLKKRKLAEAHKIQGLAEMEVAATHELVILNLRSKIFPDQTISVEAHVVQKITGSSPKVPIDKTSLTYLPDLGLADPEFNMPAKVNVLLSTEVLFLVMRPQIIRGTPEQPVAVQTTFGWIIGGGSSIHNQPKLQCNIVSSTLDQQLRRFWEIDQGHTNNILTLDEEKAEKHYTQTTIRREDGSFQVRLPFKEELPTLGNSKQQAFRRLINLESRLGRHNELREQYLMAMQALVNDGHLEKVPSEDLQKEDKKVFYLPHHAVLKTSSSTTKIRIVFDASAKSTLGTSLNDTMMIGPVLQQDLHTLLIRWRFWLIAMTADIKQMYLQIYVHPDDRDFLRILWRSNTKDEIVAYRMRKVTFGTAAAPFQAVRTLQRLAEEYADKFPIGARILKNDFYIDDCITGANTLQEALRQQSELLKITKEGNFSLRKWSSSHKELLLAVPPEMRESQLPLNLDSDDQLKALGLIWNPSADDFRFVVQPPKSTKITKRSILSEIARVFDPLGFISPVTIISKIIMQALWKADTAWDSSPPQDIVSQWLAYQQQLQGISKIRIPRCINIPEAHSHQLHVFADASEKAFAAAIYLRSLSLSSVRVRLVTAKTRVAPVKAETLPRLELCAAVLAAELLEQVRLSLPITVEKEAGWTDSTIVLAWIRSDALRWRTFERNRIVKIQKVLSSENWSHVPGIINPADIPTRGLTVEEFLSKPTWFNGPYFLHSPEINPQPPVGSHGDLPQGDVYTPSGGSLVAEKDFSSKRSNKSSQHSQLPVALSNKDPQGDIYTPSTETTPHQCLTISTSNVKNISRFMDLNEVIQKYSSWLKLRRHTAILIKFYRSILKKEIVQPGLSPSELMNAQYRLIHFIQQQVYSQEIKCLQRKSQLPKKSPLNSLSPFIDEQGILRVGGRLRKSNLQYDQKYPALVPRHHLSWLLVRWQHERLCHGGVQLVHYTTRQRFWIIRAKDLVKSIINKCTVCVTQKAKLQQQYMADLPKSRVTMQRPFNTVGVDYAGPIVLKDSFGRSPKTFKAYIGVFVCFCTKAVHLEIVSGLSTDAFLATLTRFVNRRGRPSTIHSDNGTNFIGAKRELQELFDFLKESDTNSTLQRHLSADNIEWKLIPPSAPHMGGLWEAAVKSTKHHLQRVIGSTLMNFEEAATLLSSVEACLNSRPLCKDEGGPDDLVALTPGHFLIGAPLVSLPSHDLTNVKVGTLCRWQRLQLMQQQFWRRWHLEYLQQLQKRTKWRDLKDNLKIGDIVIIRDENSPPRRWKLGKVIECHTDATEEPQVVRAVTLKTADGVMKRPIAKLVLLPTAQDQDM